MESKRTQWWCVWILALAVPSTAQIGGTRPHHGCSRTVHDEATGQCLGASSVPTMGMLFPLGPDFYFDSFGGLHLAHTLDVAGTVLAEDCRVSDDLNVVDGAIGIGTTLEQADLHIQRSGSAEILIEADRDNSGELDHPQIRFSQDGGIVQTVIGYRAGENKFRMFSEYDIDMLFELLLTPEPGLGVGDWEFFKSLSGGAAIPVGRLNQDGDWSIRGDVFTGGVDLAEYYPVHSAVEPGDVVAFHGDAGIAIERATAGAGVRIAGIVSSDPGIVLGLTYASEEASGVDPDDVFVGQERMLSTPAGHAIDRAILHEIAVNGRAPLALTGRVPCKVTAANGAIRAGDLLAVSPLPGRAMKATVAGAVIGTALEPWSAGEGTILVLANLGWFSPTQDLEARVAALEDEVRALVRAR